MVNFASQVNGEFFLEPRNKNQEPRFHTLDFRYTILVQKLLKSNTLQLSNLETVSRNSPTEYALTPKTLIFAP